MNDARQLIDLTHSLSSDIPHWDDACCFTLQIATDYKDCTEPNLFCVQTFEGKAGIGTHIDAPAHCIPGAKTIDALRLEDVMTDCVVIHIDAAVDPQFVAMPDAVETFEKQHGTIQPNSFVIFHTGWDQHWNDPKKYRNDLQFPSIHEDTAKLLFKRNIAGIGIDTLSPDAGGKDFPVHRVILGAGKYIVENIANTQHVPATGAKIMLLPMKIKDGTEAPIRALAVVH